MMRLRETNGSGTVMKNFMCRRFLWVSILLAGSQATMAAPGQIATQPLFVGKTPQSNIMFLVDDSGSMGWTYLFADLDDYYNNNERWYCAGANTMWYNPLLYNEKVSDPLNVTLEDRLAYTPWKGADKDGNAYENRTINTGSNNPYSEPNGNVNLGNQYFYIWNDAVVADGKGDGVFQRGECALGTRIYAKDLSAEQQIDFANWYTYYRRRDFVAKRALSEIIYDSNARMGLATLHNHASVGTPIKNVDDLSTPTSSINRANKKNLLGKLFQIAPNNGTPLRRSLRDVGEYFDAGTGTPSSLFGSTSPSAPLLPAADNGACQQNFAVVMSDGFWNGSSPNVGNADGDNNTDFDGGKYGDNTSNTLADVAMHYYERDLSSSLDNIVGFEQKPDDDGNLPDPLLNRAQHLVSYTVAFGVDGTISEPPADGNWPVPVANDDTTVDDMLHAAYNSRGEFLSAKNPQQLIKRLTDAINSIKGRVGTSSALALTSTSFSEGSAIFQANFAPDKGWSGDLIKSTIDTDISAGGNTSLKLTKRWSAADMLKSRGPFDRQIITYNGKRGIPFVFPEDYTNPDNKTELSEAQLDDLMVNAPHSSGSNAQKVEDNQAFGEHMVAYLRGDSTYERGQATVEQIEENFDKTFRYRSGEKLGDITHSSPIFVGAPRFNYPDNLEGADPANSYRAYADNKKNRQEIVYVGANDGMLHGFDAETGREEFAYIPGLLFNEESSFGLHYLSSNTYSHIPYVDGTPSVQDVFVKGKWRTYLVGALRGGGKGIYVLNVTNPNNFVESKAKNISKGEFTHNDLGFGFSQPQIVRLNDGRWAAVFGNGYNSSPNGDGHAKLFIYYLDGKSGNSTPEYRILETKATNADPLIVGGDCEDIDSDCNGMSTPLALDLDRDYIIDRIYAGDLHGNMWAFDVSNTDPDEWGVAFEKSGVKVSLLQACSSYPCTKATRQPITTKPRAIAHPTRLNADKAPSLMVYYGTGQFVANGDQALAGTQSMYGVWDSGSGGLKRSNLQEQVITASGTNRFLTGNEVDYDENLDEAGWYIDLPTLRERIISPVLTGNSTVLFTTIIPDAATCEGDPDGYLMAVDALTGGQPKFTVFSSANTGISTPIAGTRLGFMPGALAAQYDGGETKVFLPDSSDGGIKMLTLTGPNQSSKITSWTTIR